MRKLLATLLLTCSLAWLPMEAAQATTLTDRADTVAKYFTQNPKGYEGIFSSSFLQAIAPDSLDLFPDGKPSHIDTNKLVTFVQRLARIVAH